MIPGARLGHYEILSVLGTGGMGEVYRARDTRLDRDVAIKILSPRLARDPDALARFEREALSVAKLSHPNILAIYEFGHTPEGAFVVSELVDGETLRAKLANGPLSPRRAVGYAQQIARGIAAAHARGIVHRDLKPENVMITRDDHVKILDFGLAKPMESADPAEIDVTRVATSAGTVMGTFGYMAPEQVRGLAVDHRTDLFAFGAMLYEMLSGDRAFTGETAADTMTAILTKEPPDLDVTRLAISPALDRIVRRCLEKAPELRFQSATDLAFALETLSTTSVSAQAPLTAAATPRAGASAAWIPWLVAAAAIVIAAGVWFLRAPPATDAPWQHFTPITEAAGEETSPALSPDGNTIAYVMQVNGRWGIYAQRVGGRNATPIVADPQRDFGGPAYSPDGSSIAFHEEAKAGGIFISGATGESVRRLTDAGFDPAWSPDGKRIVYGTEEIYEPMSRQSSSTLYVVDAAGGTPVRLVDGDGVQPSWSPSGKRIVYWSNTTGQRDLFTVAAGGGARVAVTNDAALDWSPVWSPDGRYVYFSSDRGGAMNLWRIAVDEASGAVKGVPEPVTNGVQASASQPRFSRDGSRLAFRSRVKSVNPVAIPLDPATVRAGVPLVLDGSNNIRVPSDVSPDGQMIAYFSIGERQEDIFVSGRDGKGMRRVTDDAARDRAPMFTRDGKSLVFYSTRDGNWSVWSISLDGGGLTKLASNPGGCVYALPSPIDDTVVFSGAYDMSGVHIVRKQGASYAAPEVLPNTVLADAALSATAYSYDGTRLAGMMLSSTGRSVGVATYDLRTHELTRVTTEPTNGVRWLSDNRHLVYFRADARELVVIDSVTRQRTVVNVTLPGPTLDEVFANSPDGRMIYYGAVRAEADIWIAERR